MKKIIIILSLIFFLSSCFIDGNNDKNGKSTGTITGNSENFDLEILSLEKIKMFGTDFQNYI